MNNHNQLITLNFRIQNETIPIDKVNINQPLSVPVKKALKDNNQVRELEDWVVTFNGSQLDISQKIENLGLSDGDTLKLTLTEGGGGDR